jgi:hypothetical protein
MAAHGPAGAGAGGVGPGKGDSPVGLEGPQASGATGPLGGAGAASGAAASDPAIEAIAFDVGYPWHGSQAVSEVVESRTSEQRTSSTSGVVAQEVTGAQDDLQIAEGASLDDEDVLELEGIADDQVGLLPVGEQEVDECSDEGPPALADLSLAAPPAVFGGESSSGDEADDGSTPVGAGEGLRSAWAEDENEGCEVDGGVTGARQAPRRGASEEPKPGAPAADIAPAEKAEDRGETTAADRAEMLRRVWFEKFERLQAYEAEHGHPHVRQDEPLGAWVTVQRQKLKQGRLSRERERMLKGIGGCLARNSCACTCRADDSSALPPLRAHLDP